jgi:hypothetical protein
MFLVETALCDVVYPVDRRSNRYGYGIDILLGYACIKRNRKRCVIDDRVEVRHREGSGYPQDAALRTMYRWGSSGRFDRVLAASVNDLARGDLLPFGYQREQRRRIANGNETTVQPLRGP